MIRKAKVLNGLKDFTREAKAGRYVVFDGLLSENTTVGIIIEKINSDSVSHYLYDHGVQYSSLVIMEQKNYELEYKYMRRSVTKAADFSCYTISVYQDFESMIFGIPAHIVIRLAKYLYDMKTQKRRLPDAEDVHISVQDIYIKTAEGLT